MRYLVRNVRQSPCKHCGKVLEFYTASDGLCLVPDGGHPLFVEDFAPGYSLPEGMALVPLDEHPELARKPMVVRRFGYEQVA